MNDYQLFKFDWWFKLEILNKIVIVLKTFTVESKYIEADIIGLISKIHYYFKKYRPKKWIDDNKNFEWNLNLPN